MRLLFLTLFGLGLGLCLWSGCQREAPSSSGAPDQAAADTLSQEELVRRGGYVVSISGCNDCHTPKKMTDQGPVPDESLLLSGHPASLAIPEIVEEAVGPGKWVLFNEHLTAAVGPWGVTFAANLTPDETGIASWTEENFFRAIRQGKHKGLENGRPILPPMPWQAISNMTDDDLRAVFSYLKSIPPVNNLVPEPIPAVAR